MVAAVAPSSHTAAPVQERQRLEKKTEGENGHHFGALPSTEKCNTAVRKLRNREITSRYKAATVVPAPPVVPPALGRRNPSPIRQPSPSKQPSPVRNRSSISSTVTTSEALLRHPSPTSGRCVKAPDVSKQPSPSRQPSPVRNRSSCSNTTITTEPPLRHPSPTLGRSINAPDVSKRAFSAERRRRWPAVTPDGKVASASSADGVLASVKPRVGTGRGPELWPSMSASRQVESKGIPTNGVQFEGRDKESSKPPDHTLKPTANGTHLSTDRSVDPTVQSPQRKGSPIHRHSVDQAENAHPATNLHFKPDQQRWPGISNGKVFGGAMTRSMDLSIDRERPFSRSAAMLVQGRPGTPSSRTTRPITSQSLNRSVNEAQVLSIGQVIPRRNPTPTRGRVGPDSGTHEATAHSGNGAHQSHSTTADTANCLRQLSQDSVATVDSCIMPCVIPCDNTSDTESVSSGGSGPWCRGPGQGTTVPARVWQDMSNRFRLFSEADQMHVSKSDIAVAGVLGVKAVQDSRVVPMGSQQSPITIASITGSMTSPWPLSPGRVMNNPGSILQLTSSPQHTKGFSSPLRGLPSPQRSRPVSGTIAMSGTARNLGGMMVNFGFDGRNRGKKALTQQEEAQLLCIFHNRWLQWRFVNARAEAVMSAQKSAAERSLYNVWVKTSELRTSVAMQHIKLQQARQTHKLHSILSTHAAHLQNWETLEEEHSSALTGVMVALEAAILRVPVTGGAKADVHAVEEALGSAVDVLNAVEVSVSSLSPKAEKMDVLLSQLADTAAQERALLEECGDLLSLAASLEVEECSLHTHLIQLESEKALTSHFCAVLSF
ncbi:unnamed protein product [Sphagnum jensenii]|uniref:Uncharacterized protein n=1 Tax=Sphagnum jensenii TaxID=128206 RepID=A0ABP0WWU4_9BRYO